MVKDEGAAASDRARTAAFTTAALAAFAGNSILCRMALASNGIDAATFSTVRLASGAVALFLILAARGRGLEKGPSLAAVSPANGSWPSAATLFLYAVPFSFAYVSLSAGAGALILFGSVQATMILAALRSGERPRPLQWTGLGLALGGLVYLLLPGLGSPPLAGSLLMALAGFSWGVYSLRGRGAPDPLRQTGGNFARSVPLAVCVSLLALPSFHAQARGILLAVLSGALASGLGYVLWYAALRSLSATRAAVVQLSVPVLAAAGGVVFLSETVSWRLALAAAMVLGGIGLTLVGRERRVPSAASAEAPDPSRLDAHPDSR